MLFMEVPGRGAVPINPQAWPAQPFMGNMPPGASPAAQPGPMIRSEVPMSQERMNQYLEMAKKQQQEYKEQLQKKAEEERLAKEDAERRSFQEDARRREADVEWKEEDDEDGDDDAPKVDWAHAEKLRGWGNEGWSRPLPNSMSPHHKHDDEQNTKQTPAKVAEPTATSAVAAPADSTVSSRLDPDVPLLQTEQK